MENLPCFTVRSQGCSPSIGRSHSPPFGIGASAIPTDDFDTRVLLEPTGKGVGASVSQQINGPMRGEIHQDCPVGMTAPKRKIIGSQQARHCNSRDRSRSLYSPQERIGTHRHAHLLHRTFTCLNTEGKHDSSFSTKMGCNFQHHKQVRKNPLLLGTRTSYHPGALCLLPVIA